MNDPSRQKARARITAILLALSTLVSLAFLLFGVQQKSIADEQRALAVQKAAEAQQIVSGLRMELERTKLDLAACRGK